MCWDFSFETTVHCPTRSFVDLVLAQRNQVGPYDDKKELFTKSLALWDELLVSDTDPVSYPDILDRDNFSTPLLHHSSCQGKIGFIISFKGKILVGFGLKPFSDQ